MREPTFLKKLAEEARLQAKIESSPIIPRRLEGVARYVNAHAWRVLVVVSGLLALLTELEKL